MRAEWELQGAICQEIAHKLDSVRDRILKLLRVAAVAHTALVDQEIFPSFIAGGSVTFVVQTFHYWILPRVKRLKEIKRSHLIRPNERTLWIDLEVDLARHNPVRLICKWGPFLGHPYFEKELLSFMDDFHMEGEGDWDQVDALVGQRLDEAIDLIKKMGGRTRVDTL